MIGVFIVVMLSLYIAAACGGSDNGGSQPTATPTGTTSPPGTQASNVEGGQTEPYSKTEEDLFVQLNSFTTVPLDLREGDHVKITFEATSIAVAGGGQAGGMGARTAIILAVIDPVDTQILLTEEMTSGEEEFIADMTGQYDIIFQNPLPLEGQLVDFTYSVNQ
jgi:hypothetical protein